MKTKAQRPHAEVQGLVPKAPECGSLRCSPGHQALPHSGVGWNMFMDSLGLSFLICGVDRLA